MRCGVEILYPEGSETTAAHRNVGAPSPEMLKARLDGSLSSLIWWGSKQPAAVGLELGHL